MTDWLLFNYPLWLDWLNWTLYVGLAVCGFVVGSALAELLLDALEELK